ncbi:MAG: transcriptional repressor NrdR [Thermoleophilaceae bacterium]|nr:transcriptional repressor NrdR [Thermoleophilaceae bacterium]MEA2408358.1 transcriptional repressor NrdR [Thermoleophilaceae bacterium]
MVETRDAGDAVRRRRECAGCGNRFTTYERAETNVSVTKRDGRRERFDSRKLLGGLERAANKRPVSSEQLEALSDSIAAAVRRSGPEVEASQIGDLAERGLALIDPVAAIQFASVYRNLADLDELEAVVRRYKEDPLPGADQLALEGDPDPSDPESTIDRSPLGKSRRVAHTRRGHVRQP